MSPEDNFNRSGESEEERRKRRLERLRRLKEKLRANREARMSSPTESGSANSERSEQPKSKSTMRRIGERAWRAVFPKTERQAQSPEQTEEETKLNRLRRFGRKVSFLITGVRRDVESTVGENKQSETKTETTPLDRAKERLDKAVSYNEEIAQTVKGDRLKQTQDTIKKERDLDSKIRPAEQTAVGQTTEENQSLPEAAVESESNYDPDYDPNLASSSLNLRHEATSINNSREAAAAQLTIERKRREAAEQHANNLGLVATVGIGAAVYKTVQSHNRKKTIQDLRVKQGEDLKTIKSQKNELNTKEAELKKLRNEKPDFNNEQQRHEYIERVAAFGQETAQVITAETNQVEKETIVIKDAKLPDGKVGTSRLESKPSRVLKPEEMPEMPMPNTQKKAEMVSVYPKIEYSQSDNQAKKERHKEFFEVEDVQEKSSYKPQKIESKSSELSKEKELNHPIIEASQQTVEGIEQIDKLDYVEGHLTERGYSKQIEARDRDDNFSNNSGFGGNTALDASGSSSNLSYVDEQKAKEEAKKRAKLALQKKTAKNGAVTILIALAIAAGATILL